MAKKLEDHTGFVWKATRGGFVGTIFLWILSTIISSDSSYYIILSLLWVFVTIFTFVNSIRHLIKYKSKGFAITALVISSFFIFLFFIGFIIGVINGITEAGAITTNAIKLFT